MEARNQSLLRQFILVGFSQSMPMCVLFFIALLVIYFVTIIGNLFVFLTVLLSPKLHLPMYFLLCNLSFLDLCFSSSSIPKMLMDVFSRERTRSVTSCIVQMNNGIFLGSSESFLLALMAYDRYVAICLPLYYNIIMNWKTCRNITIIMWSGSFLISVVPINSRPMLFCMENKVDHFTCELLAVLELVCENLMFYKIVTLVVSLFTLLLPLIFVVISYILIISAILKIQVTDGRSKAFSTCASHLIVVSVFYGTVITMYVGQNKLFSSSLKYISLVYGTLTPGLNPLIYSLRNSEVKGAFKKILTKYFPEVII